MSYIGNTPGVSSQRVVLEEIISGAPKSAFTPVSGYTIGYLDVLVNGVEIDSSEFTAPDGVTVTLTAAAQIGDTVKIKTWLPRGLSDGYLKSEADARFLNLAGGTLTGRLGVGVAPYAWQTGTGVIDLGNTSMNSITSAVGTAAGNALIANNAYFDGTNWKYKFGYYATMYSTGDGLHQWKYAASGTAGANITFAEAMRIDTSGNVGIGASSPQTPLHIGGTTDKSIRIDTALSNSAFFTGWQNAAAIGVNRNPSNGVFTDTAKAAASLFLFGAAGDSYITFSTTATNNTNPAERLRIDSSGNLLVGTTSAGGFSSKLVVAGDNGIGLSGGSGNINDNKVGRIRPIAAGVNPYAGGLAFDYFNYNGSSYVFMEGLRLDGNGVLMVGKTSPDNTSQVGFLTWPNGTVTVTTNTSNMNTFHIYNQNATYNGYRFYVNVNGGISNYSGNNVNLSDERTKTNIELAGGYLDKVCAIPVKLFNYKDEAAGEQRTLGVIAQDVEAVAPELVNQDGWLGQVAEGEAPLKSIYTTDLQFALMKAIQELNAKVEAQALEIQALKEAA